MRGSLVALVALAALLLTGCAMGAAAPQEAIPTTPAQVSELPRLEAELKAAREGFDEELGEVTAGDADACRDLCLHRRQICAIAERICAVAERHPEHQRAAASCSSARQTCADVTERTPDGCACKEVERS